jgi:hypothetical protein
MKLNEKKFRFGIENNEWQGVRATAFERLKELTKY